MKIILGLSGMLAAGKGTITEYLKNKYQAVNFRFSDPFRETLEIYDLDVSRENMQKLSTLMRQHFGEDVLAKAMTKKAKHASDGLIVIDGVRRFTDIENLIKLPEFHLVAIKVDQKIRFERCVNRKENIGDATMTFDEFCVKEAAEAESQIPAVMAHAEFAVDNNGTMEDLQKQIDEILNKLNTN